MRHNSAREGSSRKQPLRVAGKQCTMNNRLAARKGQEMIAQKAMAAMILLGIAQMEPSEEQSND